MFTETYNRNNFKQQSELPFYGRLSTIFYCTRYPEAVQSDLKLFVKCFC